MTDEEYVEKLKSINFNMHGRTEGRNLPGAVVRAEGDDRFSTLLPDNAAESNQHREELIHKAKESMKTLKKTKKVRHYELHPTGKSGTYEVERKD